MFWKRGIKFLRRIGVTLTLWYSLAMLTVTAIACVILYHRLHRKLYKQVNYTLKDDAKELSLFLSRPGVTIDDFRGELQRETITKKSFRMSGRLLNANLETIVASDNFFFLFNVAQSLQHDLERGVLSKDFRRQFKDKKIALSDDVTITTEKEGTQWRINDKGQTYTVMRKGNVLSIYYSSYHISKKTLANIRKGKRSLETTHIKGHAYQYRVRTLPIIINGELRYVLQLAIYLKYVDKTLENYLENVSCLIPGSWLVSIIVGWLIARRGLLPISKMSKTTQQITASRLSKRLEIRGTDDELDELAKTLNTMLDRLENSFNQMSQFTADVSHELRTPIATLRTATEVILTGNGTIEDYRAHCENSLEHLDRITRMVNDLLLLSRSDSGTERPEMVPMDIAHILIELHGPFRIVAESKNVNLTLNCHKGIEINGNATLLRRLFSNLIDNALKCTPPGGSIDLDLKDNGDKVVVYVKDSGIGISKKDCSKIFDRFYRVDESRSRKTGGTGLGLSICKCIAELHKGKIEVKSELGVGTTFTITLPKDRGSVPSKFSPGDTFDNSQT